MKKTKSLLALILAFAMIFSAGVCSVYAAPADDLAETDFSLAISRDGETLTVALNCAKAITAFGASGGDMSVEASNGNDASAYFTLTNISTGVLKDMTPQVASSHWGASAEDNGNGDSMDAGTWVTYLYTVSESLPNDTYTFKMELDETIDVNFDEYSCSYGTITNTYTVGSTEPAPTDDYTANISTTSTEFTVDDTFDVTVNVGGKIGSFASSAVTLTYDPTYLTFNQDASTLNDAGVDLTTANTIKLIDYGETNAYPAAYVLNFTAKQATTDAATLVTLTDARFSTAENAISSSLIEATGENALSLTIKNADLDVTLPDSGVVTGNTTVPYGEDYTFTAKNNTTYMYYDYTVSATMGDTAVSAENIVNNNDGTWTIKSVTGDLEISVTETPKTYTVTVNGDSTVTAEEIAKVTTSAVEGKATYNTALTYTLPAGQAATETVDGWHYTATVTVNGASYTATANNLTYTIAGADVKGNVVITLSKVVDPADSVKVTIEDSNEIQKDGVIVTEFTAAKNSDVILTLVPEAGYTYVINDGTSNLPINTDNTFVVKVGTSPIELTVTKTLDTSSVKVQAYLTLDGEQTMWLVTINGNDKAKISGKTYSYDSKNMFWSSKYEAYCYLVVAGDLGEDDAKAMIGATLVEANAEDVEYNMDVNNTNGDVDANDAQLVYNMYQTKAYDGFTAVDMIKFLEADLNDSVGVNSTDVQVIVNRLLNITAGN